MSVRLYLCTHAKGEIKLLPAANQNHPAVNWVKATLSPLSPTMSKRLQGQEGRRKKRSDRRKSNRERVKDVGDYLKSTSLGTFILSRKAYIYPHTPFLSLSPSSTHNLVLHWFALQCSRQATTCESNYSYRERLGEREGGRDRGIEEERASEEPEIMPPGCVYVRGKIAPA